MGQKGLPHSLKASTIGAGNPLVSHKDKRFNKPVGPLILKYKMQ